MEEREYLPSYIFKFRCSLWNGGTPDFPTVSMEGMEELSKPQLISMIHFLEKRDESSKKEKK